MGRSALEARLDDHDHVGQGGEDAVAGWESPGLGAGAQRRLRKQETGLADLAPESFVRARVHNVEPAADDGNRRSGAVAGSENAEMSSAVDAEGEPRDHVHPRAGEIAAEIERDVAAIPGAPPAADDRHARSVERGQAAEAEQDSRRFGIVGQGGRVLGPAQNVHADTGTPIRLPLPLHVDGAVTGHRPCLLGRPPVERVAETGGTHLR